MLATAAPHCVENEPN